jgi:integrase
MAKRVQDVALGTRTARLKLPGRHKPYFRAVMEGVQIGYRRSTIPGKAGTWIGRRYLGNAAYETKLLGTADDLPEADQPADGVRVLTFDQAQSALREWSRGQVQAERAEAAAEASPTVRKAVEAYIAARKLRADRAGRDAELRLTHHVLAAPLADAVLATLTDADLTRWRDGLRRGGRGVKKDAPALAPATLARLLNDLRAALTAAARKARLPGDVLTTIREGLRAPEAPDRARPKQVLPDPDVRRLVETAFDQDDDFGALVLVLAATGCRFDQAARLTVADLQAGNQRVMVPTSNKGRGNKAQSHIAVPLPPDVLARLRPLVAGRRGHERLLVRWHHKQLEGDKAAGRLPDWVRTERRPWTVASEMTRPWRAALTAAELPGDLVPYCLRHSSIVRGLRAGLPVRLVAAVHDTSIAMIEKHYGAFIVDATEDLLRRAAVPLAPTPPAAPVSLAAARVRRAQT